MFETSAKLGTNVDSAVLALMREVLHHREFAAQEIADAGKEGGRYLCGKDMRYSFPAT